MAKTENKPIGLNRVLQFGKHETKTTTRIDENDPSKIIHEISIFRQIEPEDIPLIRAQLQEREDSQAPSKPGPKGPRKPTLHRIKLIGASGETGRPLCEYLNHCKIPLPSKKLQTFYPNDWVSWFNTDPSAVYKQISRDRSAFRKLK
jgi:hypothetical protein